MDLKEKSNGTSQDVKPKSILKTNTEKNYEDYVTNGSSLNDGIHDLVLAKLCNSQKSHSLLITFTHYYYYKNKTFIIFNVINLKVFQGKKSK